LAACGLSVGGLQEDGTNPLPDASADAWWGTSLDAAAAGDSPFAPPPPGPDAAPAPGDGASLIDAGGPALGDAGACDADLATDPAHCGRCDRDCAGGSCSAGACAPAAIIEAANPIRAMGVSDEYIVWVDDEPTLYRRPLEGGAAQAIFSPTDSVS